MNEQKLKINIEIIINNSLYRKQIIDKETFSKVNELLLRRLNQI